MQTIVNGASSVPVPEEGAPLTPATAAAAINSLQTQLAQLRDKLHQSEQREDRDRDDFKTVWKKHSQAHLESLQGLVGVEFQMENSVCSCS